MLTPWVLASPEAILASKSHAATMSVMLIRVSSDATQGHGDIWASPATYNHVCVCDSTAGIGSAIKSHTDGLVGVLGQTWRLGKNTEFCHTLCWPWEMWPCPIWESSPFIELALLTTALRKLAPTLNKGTGELALLLA